MKGWAVAALALALGLTIGLLIWQGWREVADALALAGWGLLMPVPLFLLSLIPATLGWRAVFPKGQRPPFSKLLVASWLGSSVNWLLPVAQVGGVVARALWLKRQCPEIPGSGIAAATVVDKTLQAVSQALVGWIGVVLLVTHFDSPALLWASVGMTAILCVLLGIFVQMQRGGFFQKLVRQASRAKSLGGLAPMIGQAQDFDAAIREVYRRPGSLAVCVAWRLLSRLAYVAEMWWILRALGLNLGFTEALFLECLGQTVRAASFLVPGSYGVQEGGFVFLGKLLNIAGDLALALALGKRVRELLVGVPALLLLQATIGFSFLKRGGARRRSEATTLSVTSDTPAPSGETSP